MRTSATRTLAFASQHNALQACENTSRLAAMAPAGKSIEDLLENLRGTYQRSRQSMIDEELFDVISGFEALTGDRGMTTTVPNR